MKSTDLFFKEKYKNSVEMPIIFPSGKESGEFLTICGPNSNETIEAIRKYRDAIANADDQLAESLEKAKESKDFSDYNEKSAPIFECIYNEFAAGIVCGWTLEDEFSKDALLALFEQFPKLATDIHEFAKNILEKYEAK